MKRHFTSTFGTHLSYLRDGMLRIEVECPLLAPRLRDVQLSYEYYFLHSFACKVQLRFDLRAVAPSMRCLQYAALLLFLRVAAKEHSMVGNIRALSFGTFWSHQQTDRKISKLQRFLLPLD